MPGTGAEGSRDGAEVTIGHPLRRCQGPGRGGEGRPVDVVMVRAGAATASKATWQWRVIGLKTGEDGQVLRSRQDGDIASTPALGTDQRWGRANGLPPNDAPSR